MLRHPEGGGESWRVIPAQAWPPTDCAAQKDPPMTAAVAYTTVSLAVRLVLKVSGAAPITRTPHRSKTRQLPQQHQRCLDAIRARDRIAITAMHSGSNHVRIDIARPAGTTGPSWIFMNVRLSTAPFRRTCACSSTMSTIAEQRTWRRDTRTCDAPPSRALRAHRNHEPVLDVTREHPLVGLIHLMQCNGFDVGGDVVPAAEIEHFLCFLEPTNQ